MSHIYILSIWRDFCPWCQAGLSIGDPWQYDANSLLRPFGEKNETKQLSRSCLGVVLVGIYIYIFFLFLVCIVQYDILCFYFLYIIHLYFVYIIQIIYTLKYMHIYILCLHSLTFLYTMSIELFEQSFAYKLKNECYILLFGGMWIQIATSGQIGFKSFETPARCRWTMHRCTCKMVESNFRGGFFSHVLHMKS